MSTIPLKIKIIAAISLFLFALAMTVSIVIGGKYTTLAGEYEEIYNEQKGLEQWIYNQNSEFYKDLLINGFSSEEVGMKDAVYAAVKPFYRYRLKIDEKVANSSSYPLTKNSCTITIEEYYLSHATNYLPQEILDYFKYLNNKGAGGLPTPDETIYEDILQGNFTQQFSIMISGCTKEISRRNEGNTTFIDIFITDMVTGSSEISINLSEVFMEHFNVDSRFINIWTVI